MHRIIKKLLSTKRYILYVIFGITVFLFSISVMFMARQYLIPKRYQEQINGNIPGDPQLYLELAVKKSEEIKSKGISAFELRPEGQGPSGVASILFLVTENPFGFVFINALLHALSCVVLILLLEHWFDVKVCIAAALPLVFSPYMFVWFSQLNKDSFVLTGEMMIIYAVTSLALNSFENKSGYKIVGNIILCTLGAWFVSIPRPYVNQINIVFIIPIWMFITFLGVVQRKKAIHLIQSSIVFALVFLSLGLNSTGAASNDTLDKFYNLKPKEILSMIRKDYGSGVALECVTHFAEWETAPWVPQFIDQRLKAMVCNRCLTFTVLQTHSNIATLNSVMDTDIFPNGTVASLWYMPRGAQLGILSPLPAQWFYNFKQPWSFFYAIAPLEALLLYVGFVSIIIWIIIHGNFFILIPIFISCMIMTIYGTSVPFLGTLYRFRYPFWMIIICLGLAASIDLFKLLRKGNDGAEIGRV